MVHFFSHHPRLRGRLVPLGAAGIAMALAACGGTATSPGGTSGTPVRGGTLKILGQGDVDHMDPVAGYYTVTYMLERAWTRQLVSYPASTDVNRANTIVADLATEVPTKGNGGISPDGKTYTFHIRKGAMWNTNPPRQVTSKDELREFKRMCNPKAPVGAPSYYESTIAGFKQYCEPMLKINATVSAIDSYMKSHDISGITTPDDSTIVFTLTQPASDFLNIMALPFTSPAPQEYLQYVPDSAQFAQHTISDGPYQITSYQPGKEIKLDRNPAWKQASDPIRHDYVDHIKVTEGLNQNAVQQQIAAGTGDVEWDQPPPTPDLAQLLKSHDPRLVIGPSGSLNPYVVFNLQSPNASGAVKNVKVRQAIEYAIDKVSIAQIYGGESINKPWHQVLTRGNNGYEAFNLYSTSNDRGDAAKAKQLLQQAGYGSGLTLKMIYRTNSNHPKVAQSIQADLAKAGITLHLTPVPPSDFYSRYLETPALARQGVWDLAAPGWVPDWYGNNGRTMIQPLFDGRSYGTGTTNYGDYNNPDVNSWIDQALSAPSPSAAGHFWHKCDMQIMKDAAIVPLLNQQIPLFHSSKVHNFIYMPTEANPDITNLWLSH